jgi:hypothetical protein
LLQIGRQALRFHARAAARQDDGVLGASKVCFGVELELVGLDE